VNTRATATEAISAGEDDQENQARQQRLDESAHSANGLEHVDLPVLAAFDAGIGADSPGHVLGTGRVVLGLGL
jgi:hypothetical protein